MGCDRVRGEVRAGVLGSVLLPAHSDWGTLLCVPQVKAGLGINVIGLVIVMVAINTWGINLFHLDTYPTWAKVRNVTDQA